MNFLLRLKHWQLFSLFFGLSMVANILLSISVFANTSSELTVALGSLIFVVVISLFFGWFWTLGNQLFPKLPEQHGLILSRFKIFMLVPIIYFFTIILYTSIAIGFNSAIDSNDEGALFFMIILPIHLFSMFCLFYSLRFVAKSLKTVELQHRVSFGEYAGEFFLMWFFPIGIWFIQPRINSIFKANNYPQNYSS